MSIFAKIATAATGAIAAIAFSAASAAVFVTSPDSSTTLDGGNPILIGNDLLEPGMFMDTVSFDTADFIVKANGSVDVRFSSGNPAGVANMVMAFDIDGDNVADYSFNVTNAAGVQTLNLFSFPVLPNSTVTAFISGTVFENLGQDANYDIVITADPIPLPAAGVFLLTGLAGAAGLRIRKKA